MRRVDSGSTPSDRLGQAHEVSPVVPDQLDVAVSDYRARAGRCLQAQVCHTLIIDARDQPGLMPAVGRRLPPSEEDELHALVHQVLAGEL
jgi:hypothetical protein